MASVANDKLDYPDRGIFYGNYEPHIYTVCTQYAAYMLTLVFRLVDARSGELHGGVAPSMRFVLAESIYHFLV